MCPFPFLSWPMSWVTTLYSICSREFGCIWLNLSTQNAPVYVCIYPVASASSKIIKNMCQRFIYVPSVQRIYVFKQVCLHLVNFFVKGGTKVRCIRTYTHSKEKMLNMYLQQQPECSGNNHNSLVCLMFYSDNCSAVWQRGEQRLKQDTLLYHMLIFST